MNATFSSEPAEAMTFNPWALAIWITAAPTGPAPAVTKAISPFLALEYSFQAWYAVRPGVVSHFNVSMMAILERTHEPGIPATPTYAAQGRPSLFSMIRRDEGSLYTTYSWNAVKDTVISIQP